MENWKTIEGFDEYEVSDLGRVRRAVASINTHIGRILKPNTVTIKWLENQLGGIKSCDQSTQ